MADGVFCSGDDCNKFIPWAQLREHGLIPHFSCHGGCNRKNMTSHEQYEHHVLAHGWGKEDN